MNSTVFMNYILPALLVIGFAVYMFRPKKSKIERNMGDVVYHYLAPKDAEAKLNEEGIILLDVRNEEYYAKSHLQDSINFPYVDIHHTARRRLPNKKAQIVVYDNDNGSISKAACQELYSLGYKNVYDIGQMRSFSSRIVNVEQATAESEASDK